MASDYRYELTETASQDLDHIISYIVEDLLNPHATTSLVETLTDTLEMLCQEPDAGTPVENRYLLRRDVRKVFVKNLIVYYIFDAKLLNIIVSTFDMDYILIKQENFDRAMDALAKSGYEII